MAPRHRRRRRTARRPARGSHAGQPGARGRFDPQRARDRFISHFTPALTTVLAVNGEMAGFYAWHRDEQGLYLGHLYIRPSLQGLGAAALARLFTLADSQGLDIRLGALKESDANRFYLRHGFVPVESGEFDNYYVRRAVMIGAGLGPNQVGAP